MRGAAAKAQEAHEEVLLIDLQIGWKVEVMPWKASWEWSGNAMCASIAEKGASNQAFLLALSQAIHKHQSEKRIYDQGVCPESTDERWLPSLDGPK